MAGLFEQVQQNTKEKLPDEWVTYLKPGTAQYEAAVLLNSQGKLPKIIVGKTAKETTNAQFNPDNNTITVNPKLEKQQYSDTLAHEFTHALSTAMSKQVFDWRDQRESTGKQQTGIDLQFLEAWRKLHPGDSKLPYTHAPTLFGGSGYNDYRFSLDEIPAWAVGRMEDPRKTMTQSEYEASAPGGSHVDPTIAQEQAILRDLYARKIKNDQQSNQSTIPWWKDPFGFSIK